MFVSWGRWGCGRPFHRGLEGTGGVLETLCADVANTKGFAVERKDPLNICFVRGVKTVRFGWIQLEM